TSTSHISTLSLHDALPISNAIKFLGGIEELQVRAQREQGHWQFEGRLPWITNLRPSNCLVAIVAAMPEEQAGIWVAELGDPGLRSEEHTSELQSRENLVCR